jgi:two-component system, OmpR family, sensor histidine kinase CiaH
MFHSTALKLTLWYLAIVLALSLSLSVVIYRFASDELARNTRRQIIFFNNQLDPVDFNNFAQLRQKQLNQGLNRLRGDFILFNVLVLAGGGALSYALARRTLKPIEESLETQKRFASDASHELRTPLAAILAENEVTLRNSSLTKLQAVKQLHSNIEEVEKLRSLADGLLRLATSDRQTKLTEIVSLKEAATEAQKPWSKIAAGRNIAIKSDFKPAKVRGDYQSLVDLVSILLDNAVKYSSDGSQVKLNISKQDKEAIISVEDKGKGISAKELPKIFERFYRTDTGRGRNQPGGYGLGLAIAKKIVDLHRGSIEVTSAPERGSIFKIRLPSA